MQKKKQKTAKTKSAKTTTNLEKASAEFIDLVRDHGEKAMVLIFEPDDSVLNGWKLKLMLQDKTLTEKFIATAAVFILARTISNLKDGPGPPLSDFAVGDADETGLPN